MIGGPLGLGCLKTSIRPLEIVCCAQGMSLRLLLIMEVGP